MTHLTLSVLGALQVAVDGEPVTTFRSAKTRALLVYLALESNRPHSRDALAGLFWPDQPNQTARDNLRQTLAILRKAIGDAGNASPPTLDITRDTIQFKPGSDHCVDVVTFTTLLHACAAHRHRHSETCRFCADNRQQAVALYRGDFLDQFYVSDSAPFEEWAVLKRERLRELALEALYQLVEFHTAQSDHKQALNLALRQLTLDPWREEAHRQAMRALALDGRHSAALAQYEHCRRRLAEELGVEPAQETIALSEVIKAQALGTPKDNFPSPLLGRAPVCQLPSPVTPLVGRAAELADLDRLLSDPGCRLLSIVGPGGAGKTRLAIAAAAAKRLDFREGVFFVSLASLDSADLLAPTLLAAIGAPLQGQQEPGQQLISYLREREVLLVLDNLEHLLAGTPLLAEVLRRAPCVALLVTSRERLNLHGEWVLDLHGLEVPKGEKIEAIERYSAVQLFLQSAKRGRGASLFSDEEKSLIVRICRMVEGMPLGIELAAAWVRTLSCRQIADEIEKSFGFLTTALRDVPERHRNMRAVFEHSWKLLNAEERAALSRLAVFQGGFQREAAKQVAAASLPLLAALVDKSLVRSTTSEWYDLHNLVRQFAYEELVEARESEETHRRHAEYYLALVETAAPELDGEQGAAWLARLEQENDNLRAALQWALARHEAEQALRLAGGLWQFWLTRGYESEGRHWLQQALKFRSHILDGAAADSSQLQNLKSLVAKALNAAGFLARMQSDYAQSLNLHEESLALVREQSDRVGIARTLNHLGNVAFHQGDYARALTFYQESLTLHQALVNPAGKAQVLSDLGNVAFAQGDYERARQMYEESLALNQGLANTTGVATALINLGAVALEQCEYDRATPLLEEVLAMERGLKDKRGIALILINLGDVARYQADYSRARASFVESLQLLRELGDRGAMTAALEGLAGVAVGEGQSVRAARLCGAAEALREALHMPLMPALRTHQDATLASARAQLGDEQFMAAQAEGKAMNFEQAIDAALSNSDA